MSSSSSSSGPRPHARHRPQSLPFVPHAAPFLPSFASLVASDARSSQSCSGVGGAASTPLSPTLAALSPSFLLSHDPSSGSGASRRSSGASSSSGGTHASSSYAALRTPRTPRARAWSLDEAKTPTLASCSQQQAQAQQQAQQQHAHAEHGFSALPHRVRAGTTTPAPAPTLSLTSPSATAPPRPLHAPSSAALEARRLRSSSSSSSSTSPASLSVGGGGGAADAHTYEYEPQPQRFAHDEARLVRLAAEAKAAASAASAAAAGRSGSSAEAAALFLRSWLQASYVPHVPSSPREEPPTVRRAALVRSYELACAELRLEPLTKAAVGKAVRAVWPEIQSKRLGPRGGSLAHYINFVPLTTLEHARLHEANRQLDAEAQTQAYASLDGYTLRHPRAVSAASSRSRSTSTSSSNEGSSSSEGSSPAKRAVSLRSSSTETARSTPAVTLNASDSMDIDAPPGLELELAGEQVARRMDFSGATSSSSSSSRLGTTAAAASSARRSGSAQFFFAGEGEDAAADAMTSSGDANFMEHDGAPGQQQQHQQQQQPDLLRAVAAYASVGALAHSPEHTPRLSSARTSPIKQALTSSLLQAEEGEEEEEFPPRASRRRVRSRTSSSALEEMGYGAQSASARAVRSVVGWPLLAELALDGMGLMTWEEIEVGCERMLLAFRELKFDEFKTAATVLYTELPREALWAIWGSSILCDAVLQAERALYEHLLRFLDEHIADPPIEAVCSALRDLAVSYPTEVQASLQGSGSRGRFPDAFIVSRTELSWRWCECLLAVNSIWADIIELRARFSLSSAHWELSPTLSTTSTSSSLSADVSDAFSAFRPHSRDESWASVHTYASSEDSSLASPPPAAATLAHEAHKWEQMRQRDVAAQQQQQQGSRHDGLGLENFGLEELHAASEADAQLMYDEAALLRCGSLA